MIGCVKKDRIGPGSSKKGLGRVGSYKIKNELEWIGLKIQTNPTQSILDMIYVMYK